MSIRVGVYQRVSTDRQDLAMQEHAVGQWLVAKYPHAVVTVYRDEGFSGKTDKRPAYNRLCADVKADALDAVVVYRLDRLSRDAVTALRLLMDWLQTGIEFFAVDQPVLSLGKDNPLRLSMVAIFAEIAQLERETIVARVKAGLAAAKARGTRLGKQPKLTAEQVREARKLLKQGKTYKQIGRHFDVGAATIHRACKGDGHAQAESG